MSGSAPDARSARPQSAGLKVHLNQVILDITAQSGPGNLLGNLLCSVANLLNGQTVVGQELTGLLNIVQQPADTPALLNL